MIAADVESVYEAGLGIGRVKVDAARLRVVDVEKLNDNERWSVQCGVGPCCHRRLTTAVRDTHLKANVSDLLTVDALEQVDLTGGLVDED